MPNPVLLTIFKPAKARWVFGAINC
jgi:hypothetical protein